MTSYHNHCLPRRAANHLLRPQHPVYGDGGAARAGCGTDERLEVVAANHYWH